MTVKHFEYYKESYLNGGDVRRGRVAVSVTDEKVKIKHLCGPAPEFHPAMLIEMVEAVQPDFFAIAKKQNLSRKYTYGVQTRQGMSGCLDWILRIRRDDELKDYPVAARLHVSMYGSMNEDINMWPDDFALLVTCADQDQEWGDKPDFWEVGHFDPQESFWLDRSLAEYQEFLSDPQWDDQSDEDLLGKETLAKLNAAAAAAGRWDDEEE